MEKVHLDGYRNFRDKYFKDNEQLFDELAKGQKPHTILITCSDSRVAPTKILSAKAGELFIARNIGNIVPPYEKTKGATQSAIEYAVNILKIENIVILGHSSCGACKHLYHEHSPEDEDVELSHVEEWLKLAYPAKNESMLEYLADKSKNLSEITEKNNVKLSLNRLMTYPYIIDGLENKKLKIYGWWYDIGTGVLESYNYATKNFEVVV